MTIPVLPGFLKAITFFFFWSHVSPLLTALSTRWKDSGGEIWGIFNCGNSKKAEAICLQTAELIDGESRGNGKLISSILLLLAKPSMEKETSHYDAENPFLHHPTRPLLWLCASQANSDCQLPTCSCKDAGPRGSGVDIPHRVFWSTPTLPTVD